MPKRQPASLSSAGSNANYPASMFHSYGDGVDYTEEETEFLKALTAERKDEKRPLTLIDGFRIARALGWSRSHPSQEKNDEQGTVEGAD